MNLESKNKNYCENLWKEYEPNLRKICSYKLASCPSEIDDVISNTYLALCKSINKGEIIDKPKAWLYATLNNFIKLKYAEMDKRKRVFVPLDAAEHELYYDVDFENVELDDDLIEQLRHEVLEELSVSDRTLYLLIYNKKLKFKNIAKILNSTESAIKQKHYRLKRKIKKIVRKKIDEQNNFVTF